MDFDLMHRRPDGTFVVRRGGMPYHVTADDPLWPSVSAAAEGVDLPPEPVPEAPPTPSSPPAPTLESLQADLARLQAQLAALAAGGKA